jgi:hypothetical protein
MRINIASVEDWQIFDVYDTDDFPYTQDVVVNTHNMLPHWGEYWLVNTYLDPVNNKFDSGEYVPEYFQITPCEQTSWINAIIIKPWTVAGKNIYTPLGEQIYIALIKGRGLNFVGITDSCRRMTPHHMEKYGVVDGWHSDVERDEFGHVRRVCYAKEGGDK